MHTIWTLDQHVARLELPPLKARIDLERPEQGLHALEYAGSVFAAGSSLLGIDLRQLGTESAELTPCDAYIRQGDLVATYALGGNQKLVVQVYWRTSPFESDDAVEIDMEVSVQTPLLDSDPGLWTASKLPAGELVDLANSMSSWLTLTDAVAGRPLSPCCWLVRPGGQSWSYAEMLQPTGLDTTEASAAGDSICLRHRLFVSRLEKGVILRARVRGALMARRNDEAPAAAACRRLLDTPPSLTT